MHSVRNTLRIFLKIFLVISIFFFSKVEVLFAQGTSNEGTDFWVAYAGHVDGTQSRLTLFLTSKVNATVTIDVGGTPYQVNGVPSTVSLIANQPQAIVIDPNKYLNVYVNTSDNVEMHPKKGIHVTSNQPIVVYSHISRNARSAACLVYPTKALGLEYYAISYYQLADVPNVEIRSSQFTIVGVEDDTDIEITPTQDSRWLPVRKAGVPFTITLDKGDIFQYQSITDITGSKIRTINSCKPFSVFSGSSKTGFCEEGNTMPTSSVNGQDNLYQQLLPVTVWGENFVTSPFYNSQMGSYDIYRIQVSTDNTIVTVNGSTTNAGNTILNNPYQKGSVITFFSKTANAISANNPINVAQFQTSENCNPNNLINSPIYVPGDPEMIILNPIEQTLKDITVYSAISTAAAPTNIRSHYINAIIKTADTSNFTIDGVSFRVNPQNSDFVVNKFIRINDQYSYITVDVSQASISGQPTHRIKAEGGFVAIAYGYGPVESYGYLAGSDLKNLNKYIEPQNALTNSPIISGCSQDPIKIYVILPYRTSSLKWDVGNGIETDPNPDASYTTETINGELSYRYKYFNDQVSFSASAIYNIMAMAVNPSPITCDENETVQLSLTVSAPPSPLFTVDNEACSGDEVTFTDNSSGNGSDINKWYWDYGDGTPVELRRNATPFKHIYTQSGDYTVKLIVEGFSGCKSEEYTQDIHIVEPPVAKFSYEFCDNIQFKDESDPIEGTVVKWLWEFNDGSAEDTSTEQNPTHTFASSGLFRVKLTIETDKGCSASFVSEVYTQPSVDAGEDFTILVGGEQALNAKAEGVELKYKWVPSTGLSNDTIPDPIASPLVDTKYTLTVLSKGGCSVSDDIFVKVLEPDIPNAFSPNGDGTNDKWAIRYLETYVHATVQIFNRYGQKVFTSDRYVAPWDGTYDGKEIPVGVYYYIIEPNNGRKRMTGSITLLR